MLGSSLSSVARRTISPTTIQSSTSQKLSSAIPTPFFSTTRHASTKYVPHPFMEFFANVRFPRTGRAWSVQECRIKSQHDLEKLWFVLLKERNSLATYQHYCQQNKTKMKGADRIAKCKASMKAILHVITERRHAYKEVINDKKFLENRAIKRQNIAIDAFEERVTELRNKTTPNQLGHVTYQNKVWRKKTMGKGMVPKFYKPGDVAK